MCQSSLCSLWHCEKMAGKFVDEFCQRKLHLNVKKHNLITDMSFTDLYAKYNCTYCQEEISGVRVKCAECPDFDICLQVK